MLMMRCIKAAANGRYRISVIRYRLWGEGKRMKLLRYGNVGEERPAIVDAEGGVRDLSGVVGDITGGALVPESLEKLRKISPKDLPLVSGTPRIGACVAGVGKFICIGLNYSDHAAESGMAVPAEPVVFMKATSAICGPYDDVMISGGGGKEDWEGELRGGIGRAARDVTEEDGRAD